MSTTPLNRRTFTAAAAATTLALSTAPARALGANDRIRLGFIGVGNRGSQLLDAFLPHSDMQVVALCDVYEPYLERANQKLDVKATTYGDFRKLIDRDDLDGVVIATPDHWHALQTIAACDAGKDVYVEKPLSITIHEGRRMIEAARRNKRVAQVGTHRRSSKLYTDLAERLHQSDPLGKITVSRAYRLSNMFPNGIGQAKPSDPPPDLDWDMWLGPRPARPFQATIAPYKFRWWDLYSSQVANWGVHYLDAIRWLTGDTAPASVCAMGGQFAVRDDRTIPDTMEAVFEFSSGRLAIFGQYEASGNVALRRGEIELRGTEGTLYIDDRGYEIVPERGGQFQDSKPRMRPEQRGSSDGDMTVQHARNFLDCMRSRKEANADIEIGHRSTTMSLLANISLATRSRLEWDAEHERITNVKEANELLHYEYRAPWKLS
jgi:predicted dehydrogenase